MNERFGFIGCGNMGSALASGVVQAVGGANVALSGRTAEKVERCAKALGAAVSSNETIAQSATYIFLGVKPQMMADVLSDIAPVLRSRTDRFVLVSMAAGLTTQRIAEMAGGEYPVLRIMPNTAVSVGEGIILYTANHLVTEGETAELVNAMSCCGLLDSLSEHLMDAGSALAGCGGAFCDLFMEALADGAVAAGLPRAKAQQYAAQVLCGAGKLLAASGKHPGLLKDEVCSPGGSTIQGVRALERGGLRAAAMEAVIAACEKNKELGK